MIRQFVPHVFAPAKKAASGLERRPGDPAIDARTVNADGAAGKDATVGIACFQSIGRSMPKMHRLSSLGVAGALAACASPQSVARLDTARADFKEKARPAQMLIQYDLAKPGGLTPMERKRREAAAEKAFSPVCAKPYAENLHASVVTAIERSTASASLAPAEALP